MKKAARRSEAKAPDILTLIKSHHEIMRECVEELRKESEPQNKKREELFIFLETLKVHSKSEQETLYACLEEVEPLRVVALEAREEHNIADRLLTEIEAMDYQEVWSEDVEAKAKVLADLVEHHMDDEEDEMFSLVRENFTAPELQALAVEYNERFKARMEKLGTKSGRMSHLLDVMSANVKAAYLRAGDFLDKIA